MKRFALGGAAGFALVEVMIAFFVFTLVAFSLIIALDTSLDTARHRNEMEATLRGLSNQLALLHGAPISPQDLDLPDDGTGIVYHLTIAPEQVQNLKHENVTGLYRVTVKAKWGKGAEADDRSVSELFFQP